MATRTPAQQSHRSSNRGDDIITCSIKMLPEDQWIAAAQTTHVS